MDRERLSDLCRRLRAGDESVVPDIVASMGTPLANFVLPIVCDPCTAEEIAQDALVRALKNLHRLRNDRHFVTWLFSIGRFLALDRRRRETRSGACKVEMADFDGLVVEGPRREEDATLRILELREAVERAVESLPATYREVIEYRYRRMLGYDELARELGLTRLQVKGRLARAREKLREKLGNLVPTWKRLHDDVS